MNTHSYLCVCVRVRVHAAGLVAEQFLESTATQLSYHGLCELNTTAKEGEISVFFRNNHFSTMIKHKVALLSHTRLSFSLAVVNKALRRRVTCTCW